MHMLIWFPQITLISQFTVNEFTRTPDHHHSLMTVNNVVLQKVNGSFERNGSFVNEVTLTKGLCSVSFVFGPNLFYSKYIVLSFERLLGSVFCFNFILESRDGPQTW